MSFHEKLEQLKLQMFDLISTKDITLLWNLDKRIEVNKYGKFNYQSFKFDSNNIWGFLKSLEEKRIYAVIAILSKNNKVDEPFIVLSQTFLITKNSSYILISKYLYDKMNESSELYNINEIDKLSVTFKYKEVKFDYKEYVKWS